MNIQSNICMKSEKTQKMEPMNMSDRMEKINIYLEQFNQEIFGKCLDTLKTLKITILIKRILTYQANDGGRSKGIDEFACLKLDSN